MKSGYKKPALLQIATEISKIDRRTLLEHKYREKSKCIYLQYSPGTTKFKISPK